jgi:hypothetical protein
LRIYEDVTLFALDLFPRVEAIRFDGGSFFRAFDFSRFTGEEKISRRAWRASPGLGFGRRRVGRHKLARGLEIRHRAMPIAKAVRKTEAGCMQVWREIAAFARRAIDGPELTAIPFLEAPADRNDGL